MDPWVEVYEDPQWGPTVLHLSVPRAAEGVTVEVAGNPDQTLTG